MLRRLSLLAAGRRSRWGVIVVWVAAAAALASFQPKLNERAQDESKTYQVRGSDSQRTDRLLDQRFSLGNEEITTIAYDLPQTGQFLGGQEKRIVADAQAICRAKAIGDLKAVLTPLGAACDDPADQQLDLTPETPLSAVSEDGRVAVTTVLTRDDATETVVGDVAAIRRIVPSPHGPPGALRAHVSGQGGLDADRAEAVKGIDGTLMLISVVLILVLLLAIYRSPVAAVVPIFVVVIAYLVAAGMVWGLVSAGATTISGQTTSILIVLMFGAGTDYCLLILSRFRDELRRTDDLQAAMANAAQRTGPAILSAGGIVVGVMLILGLSDFNATREMGPILALGMATMMLAGLTLLPATLSVLGRRVFWPRDPRRTADRGADRFWARAADMIGRHPVRTAVVATAILVLGALGNLAGRESLPFTEAFRDPPESVEGVRAVHRSFPPGRVAPLDLVMSQPLSGDVLGPLAEVPGVDTVIASASADPAKGAGDLMKADVILDMDPFSDQARDYVPRLRARLDRLLATAIRTHSSASGKEIALLGGFTAQAYDTKQAISRDNRLVVPLALLFVFLVLVAMLRAIVAPLYLVGTVVLSFAFALGVSSLIFTHVFGQPGSDPSLNTFAFIFLVALGVDYNVFLISRIREERAGGLATREAALAGLARTGGVITSAGLILAGTFSTLMALKFEAVFQYGFVICLGLLVDTFLVRAFLVPSIAVILGERNWWPGPRQNA